MEEIRKFKKRQKKLKKKEKKKKKKMKKAAKGEVDRGDGIYCSIKQKSDVPSDPPNYFLARRLPSPERRAKEAEESNQRRKERNDESGRRIKGKSGF